MVIWDSYYSFIFLSIYHYFYQYFLCCIKARNHRREANAVCQIEMWILFLIIQPQILHIELVKGSGGLGFTLSGGANTVGGCFVRDIVGGPAKEDGRLQQGDQILMVRKLFKCGKGLFL